MYWFIVAKCCKMLCLLEHVILYLVNYVMFACSCDSILGKLCYLSLKTQVFCSLPTGTLL